MRYYVNLGTTSLKYSVNSAANTIVVEDATVLPSDTPFDLRLDQGGLDEFVRVTSVSGNTLTVTRATEAGFTAKDHLAGVPVRQVLTASAIEQLWGSTGDGSADTEEGSVVTLRRAFAAGGPTTIAITAQDFRVIGWCALVSTAVGGSTCSLAGVSIDSSSTGRKVADLSATVLSSGTMNFTKSSAGIAGEVLVYGFRM